MKERSSASWSARSKASREWNRRPGVPRTAVDPIADAKRQGRRALARRIAVRASQLSLGLLVGSVVAEGAFCARDRRAFPHLNVYVADARLGVRLRPGATQRVAFGGNPVTRVRINADGYRGPDFSPKQPDEILVLGDSQVFGLGVEEDQTFSAQLATIVRHPVVNAGVPTYGPLEYQAVLEELMAKRHPRLVVYVVNLANDLFEATRPNTERHVVWDGWAVRKETAPASVLDFPGRSLLFRESHAVFAFRRFLHRKDSIDDDRALPSEGTWQDLVTAANAAKPTSTEDELLAQWEADLHKATDDATHNQQKLQAATDKAFPQVLSSREGREYKKTNGQPGDIVSERIYLSEASTGPGTKVKTVLQGAKIREQIEALIRKKAEAAIEKEESKAILASLAERAKIERRIAELRALPAKFLRAHSPMMLPLEKAARTCEAAGARLVVVVLPMDVQVSPEEWKKYDESPVDLSATKILVDDVRHAAEVLGVSLLDATATLAAAEPGAFLNADLHMSPKGHRALAVALAKALGEPPPPSTALAAAAPPPALGFTKVCACQKKIEAAKSCDALPKVPDIDCLRSYDECGMLLACLRGDKKAQPRCLPGWVNAGPLHRCHKGCAASDGCVAGTCTKAKEGHICI